MNEYFMIENEWGELELELSGAPSGIAGKVNFQTGSL